jgi:hypothetical protein
MSRFATCAAILLAIVLCWLPSEASAQTGFFLLPGYGADTITSKTSLCDVREAFGIGNFKVGDIMVGEGNSVPGVVVFPDDPARRRGESTRWKTPECVTLGSRLMELEKLNGGPFKLYGFAWDYGGTVSSWEGGKLEAAYGKKVILRFDSESASNPRYLQVSGDREFSSRHPVMRKINPRVNEIVLSLDWHNL